MHLPLFLVGFVLFTGSALAANVDPSVCKAGSAVSYYPNGHLKNCLLGDDLEVNGVNCAQLYSLQLYETGTLQRCTTRDYYSWADKLVCNQYSEVSFFPSGKLESCRLFETAVIDGKTCVEYQPIVLFENGALRSCATPP